MLEIVIPGLQEPLKFILTSIRLSFLTLLRMNLIGEAEIRNRLLKDVHFHFVLSLYRSERQRILNTG